jgi:hypothetical protein
MVVVLYKFPAEENDPQCQAVSTGSLAAEMQEEGDQVYPVSGWFSLCYADSMRTGFSQTAAWTNGVYPTTDVVLFFHLSDPKLLMWLKPKTAPL